MAQDTTPAIIVYQGDGSNKTFSVPFDKGDYGAIKVAFVRRGLTNYEYNPTTYTVNGCLFAWALANTSPVQYYYTKPNDSKVYNAQNNVVSGVTLTSMADSSAKFSNGKTGYRALAQDISFHSSVEWLGEPLTKNDWICIVRETQSNQPYVYPNNQKHIEGALDNLSRQIQELKTQSEVSLRVDPTFKQDPSKMSPIDWLNTIVRSTDGTARGFRYKDLWLEFSTDDPNKAENSKTWTKLLNTTNVTTIREWYDEEKNEYRFQYSKDNGASWKELPFTVSSIPGLETRLVTIENEQAVLRTGVKGNADAIQKTREDFASADQAIRDDMNEKDSELETILNDHTKRLNTLRTDHDDLGDDVADIQAKVPESASGSNPMVTKQQLATKQDKLTAGDNIIISNNVISATGTGGAGFDAIVVQKLPESGLKGVIYLVPSDGETPDVYDEYLWIESTGTFELIGKTKVDLSDYATKVDLSNYLPLSGGTLTGTLKSNVPYFTSSLELPGFSIVRQAATKAVMTLGMCTLVGDVNTFRPYINNGTSFGASEYKWANVFTTKLNNGADIAVPTEGGTLARLEDLENIDALPDQTGNAGKFLKTDGTTASWEDVPPSVTITLKEYDE